MQLSAAKMQSAPIQGILQDENIVKKPCKSVIASRSSTEQPSATSDTISRGQEDRRTQHLAVAKERRMGYFIATPDFQERAERARVLAMKVSPEQYRKLPLREASSIWLEDKRLYIRESSLNCYKDYLARLNKVLGSIPLEEIHIGHVREYQKTLKGAYHAASVNHDINVLSQIMRKASLWQPIREHYRALPLPETDPPKVMTEAEEDRFFAFASKDEQWCLAYFVASLTNNSTASGKELRMLQRGAIELNADPPHFTVPKNMKNPNRPRTIPLNERGVTMMTRILHRASGIGSTRPEHYVFPFRVKRNMFDPNRPASESWIKAQWKKLVDAAIEAKVISFRIKPHNLRHQAITKLLDNGVPIETVRQIAGHGVDSIVTRHYHHARLETLARAMDAIDPDKKKPAHVVHPKKEKGA